MGVGPQYLHEQQFFCLKKVVIFYMFKSYCLEFRKIRIILKHSGMQNIVGG